MPAGHVPFISQAKKVKAAFDGGRLTSNGGVMLLAMAERRLGLAVKLAAVSAALTLPAAIKIG